MKQLLKNIAIVTTFTALYSCASGTAKVVFTGGAPTKYQDRQQPLSMYACNNTSIAHKIEWGKENPVTVPYGRQVKDGEEFFISKYYIASPPLPNKFKADTPRILGVLSEDHFNLDKNNQQVAIYMDYELLKPIQLAFLPVDYDQTPFCTANNINKIPINIRCPEFKYTHQGKQKTGLSYGLGKGIGQLFRINNTAGELTTEGHLFIPQDIETGEALTSCTVEIVNDIILEHQIYFGNAEQHHEKIDLTQAYEMYKQTGKHVGLYCQARPVDEPAAGCNPVLAE